MLTPIRRNRKSLGNEEEVRIKKIESGSAGSSFKVLIKFQLLLTFAI